MHRPAVWTVVLLALSVAIGAQDTGWRAKPQTVEQTAKQRPAFNYDEARVPAYTLPDPLTLNGTTVRTRDAWAGRRLEILELFREHVYGRSPGVPQQLRFEVVEENPRAMDGAATLKRIAVLSEQGGRTHRFEITLFLPNARREPVPVFLLLNNRPPTNTDPTRRERSGFWPAEQVIARGYAVAALQNSDLAPDDKDRFREGAIRLFEGSVSGPRPGNAWGALAAWAWGASRAMDYFETDRRVDAKKVAVVGHSRGGKAALWAGAEDERFAITIANESGEGGAALSRRVFGETLARITEAFPHWFAGHYKDFAARVGRAAGRSAHAALADRAARALRRERGRRSLVRSARGVPVAGPRVSRLRALGRSADAGRRDAAARPAAHRGPPRVSRPNAACTTSPRSTGIALPISRTGCGKGKHAGSCGARSLRSVRLPTPLPGSRL